MTPEIMEENEDRRLLNNLPDNLTIVGIGGCGTTLLHSIAEHEWFLNSYAHSARTLKLIVLDTVTGEEHNSETTRMSNLQDKIRQIDGTGVSAEYLSISSEISINSLSDLTSPATRNRMKMKYPVWWLHNTQPDEDSSLKPTNITEENYKKYFDLRENLTNSNFDRGVNRLRATSKAIFYKFLLEQESLFNKSCKGTPGSKYAIIVGLGGGTGSGMFIDYARAIRERDSRASISVYAILPSTTEMGVGPGGAMELANAAIALTEIEYIKLHEKSEDSDLFSAVYLTSLEPTGFEGGRAVSRLLDSFGKAYPYLFINTLLRNKDGEGASFGKYGFIDQTSAFSVEYPAKILADNRKAFSTYLSALENSTTAKENVIKEVTNFWNNLPPSVKTDTNTNPENLTRLFTSYKDEVLEVRKLWTNSMVENLKLDIKNKVEQILQNDPHSAEFENIETSQRCADLKRYVKTISEHLDPETVESGYSRELAKLIKRNAHEVNTIGDYYAKGRTISLQSLREILITLLSCQKPDLMSLKSDILDLGEQHDTSSPSSVNTEKALEKDTWKKGNLAVDTKNLASLDEEIANITSISDSVKSKIEDSVSKQQNAIEKYVDILKQQDAFASFAEDYCSKLNESCDKLRKIVASVNSGGKQKINDNNKRTLFLDNSKYPQSLDKDVKKTLTNFEKCCIDYYHYVSAYIDETNKGLLSANPLSKLLEKSQDSVTSPSQLLENIDAVVGLIETSAEELGIEKPTLSEPAKLGKKAVKNTVIYQRINFELTEEDVVRLISSQKNKAINSIISALSGCVGGNVVYGTDSSHLSFEGVFSEDEKRKLRDVLMDISDFENGQTEIVDTIYSFHNERLGNLGWDRLIEEKKNERQTLKDKITSDNKKRTFLLSVESFVNRLYDDHISKYNELLRETKAAQSNLSIRSPAEEADVYKIVTGWSPAAMSSVGDDIQKHNLSVFDTTSDNIGDVEIKRIIRQVEANWPTLITENELGVDHLYYSISGDDMWQFSHAYLMMSASSERFTKLINFSDAKSQPISCLSGIKTSVKLGLSVPRILTHVHKFAMPWSCGVTLIACGNYLENVLGFNKTGRFREAYEIFKDNPLHHVHLLETGNYVRRKWMDDDRTGRKLALDERDINKALEVSEKLCKDYSRTASLEKCMSTRAQKEHEEPVISSEIEWN